MNKNLHFLFKSFCLAFLVMMSCTVTAQSDDNYQVAFDKAQEYTHPSRRLTAVSLTGSVFGNQTIEIPEPRKVYTNITDAAFNVCAGETVAPGFNFTGDWMHGFVYLDRGCDGVFDAVLGSNGEIPEGSDIMAFSYAEPELNSGVGYNSRGERVSNSNVLAPPSFTIPSDLESGRYMMRFKVDWASIDPLGRVDAQNNILTNGGAVCDVYVNVLGEKYLVNVVAENGKILASDGSVLTAVQHPSDEPLTIKPIPDEGYVCDAIRIRYGNDVDGVSPDVSSCNEVLIPAFMLRNGEYTLPAEYIAAEILIEGLFVPVPAVVEGDECYPTAFDSDAKLTDLSHRIKSIMYTPEGRMFDIINVQIEETSVYRNMAPNEIALRAGETVKFTVTAENRGLHYYMYIDLNNDGKFTPILNNDGTPTLSGELLSYTYHNGRNSAGEEVVADSLGGRMPSFVLHEQLPKGIYRMRLKADYDNIDPAGSDNIENNGGMVVDLLLNVFDNENSLSLFSTNGSIYGVGNAALPVVVNAYESLNITAVPVADGYEAGEIKVRHGYNLNGPQFVNGNRQWSEYELDDVNFSIPKDSVNGDVEVHVHFDATEEAEYRLVFSDEFNAGDGTQPVNEKWMRCQRMGATWNRWLSDSEEVIYIENGNLVARAIPNTDTATDNVPMITGGIKSMGRFGFTYGRVECRLFTNPWIGNFPALWLMPEDQSAGWPDCGEIDIFETIDTQHRSWHTIHSNWTYDLGYKNSPKSSFDVAVSLDRYHTYALEWDETSLVWFVDGVEVGRYEKSTVQNDLNQGQWPFDKHFHLILNQSVGNGAWAANADVTHTYETLFDWVRVYQKVGMENTHGTVGVQQVQSAENNIRLRPVAGGVEISADTPTQVVVCDVVGRVIYNTMHEGSHVYMLDRGVYIVNGKKIFVQ